MNRIEGVSVRQLHAPSRAPELFVLVQRAFADLSIDPPSSVLRETTADIAARIASDIALIAEASGALIGCVFCTPRPASLYVGRLAVRDEWRGQGVASALLAGAKDLARQLGLSRVELSTRIALTRNIRLFEAHGFEITAAQTHAGFAVPTSYDMTLTLATGEVN